MADTFNPDQMEQLEKIKALAELLSEREQIIQRVTEEIFDLIEPTVLQALFDLFEVPDENITWIDVQVSGRTLVVAASVVYESDRKVPTIIEHLSPNEGKTGRSVRLFRAGIPIELAFAGPSTIKQFIIETVQTTHGLSGIEDEEDDRAVEVAPEPNQPEPPTATPSTQEEFDDSLLTKSQLQQMIWFQQHTRKMRH